MLSVVQASLSSQSAGQLSRGSQVSPDSTAPLPHTAQQSLSLLALQAKGQQSSSLTQSVTGVNTQTTSQLVGCPVMLSVVQAI